MSKFPARNGSALLVIDVQNGVVEDAWERDKTVANIKTMVDKARAAKAKVIWVQHSDPYMEIGSEDWKIVPELVPLASEAKVQKRFRSSFEETDLDSILEKGGISHLYITGAQTNNCVRHTTHAALERGYDITLISDAHTTSDTKWGSHALAASEIVYGQNRSLTNYTLPGRKCDVMTTAEVVL